MVRTVFYRRGASYSFFFLSLSRAHKKIRVEIPPEKKNRNRRGEYYDKIVLIAAFLRFKRFCLCIVLLEFLIFLDRPGDWVHAIDVIERVA